MTDKAPAHDIWLPPLAAVEAYLYINGKHRGVSLDYRFDADLPEGTRRIPLITAEQADDYARAAVEADRKRREQDLVAKLIEALTELCDEIDKHEIHATISETNILWFKRKAREALVEALKGEENG